MLFLGADHGGYDLKEKVKEWLAEWGYEFEDLGALDYDANDDYPVFAFRVAGAVAEKPDEHLGLLICRSGGGVTIAANKVAKIRAVSVASEKEALHAKEHNHANVIALSGDWVDEEEAQLMIKTFIDATPSSDVRHSRRLKMIAEYEQERNQP